MRNETEPPVRRVIMRCASAQTVLIEETGELVGPERRGGASKDGSQKEVALERGLERRR